MNHMHFCWPERRQQGRPTTSPGRLGAQDDQNEDSTSVRSKSELVELFHHHFPPSCEHYFFTPAGLWWGFFPFTRYSVVTVVHRHHFKHSEKPP